MWSEGKASRSFQHNEGDLAGMQKLKSVAHFRYHRPYMTKEEFMRVSRLPGMKAHLDRNQPGARAGAVPSVPWHMYGPEKHKEFHEQAQFPEQLS